MPEQFLDYETARGMRDELTGYAQERLNLSSNARLSIREVYLRTLEDGKPESAADRMAAIAVDIASADMKYFPPEMPQEEKIERVRQRARRNLKLYVSNKIRANTPTNLNMGRWRGEYDEDGNLTRYTQPSQLGSACFVLPVEDTFGNDVADLQDGILEAWVTQQLVHKGGGGTGFSFQRLRPKGSLIGYNPAVQGMRSISWDGTRGVSSGYESFLNFYYNQSTEAVKQGNSRRGANMGIQRVDHVDFLDHMYAKFGRDKGRSEWRMKNFNLSLAVTDEFMEAALDDRTYTLYNPHRADPKVRRILERKFGVEHPELVRREDLATREQFEEIMKKNKSNEFNPLTTPSMYVDIDGSTVVNAYTGDAIGIIVDDIVRISARKVLDTFAQLAHTNGEPGMIFLDRIGENNPLALVPEGEIEATNPCGEQPLPPYDACNLASINAGSVIRYKTADSREALGLEERVMNDRFTKVGERSDGKYEAMWVDWDDLDELIHDGVRMLDNVIDRSDFPAAKIREMVGGARNIGLGYMGVWDAMVLMKMRYGSDESYEFADALARKLHEESLKASQELARERGAFPLWEKSAHNSESETYKWMASNPKTIPDKFRGQRKLSDRVQRERVITYGGGEVRNVCNTTQAPTGTIRRSVGYQIPELGLDNLAIASGIEPFFSLFEQSNIVNTQVEDFAGAAVELFRREGLPVGKLIDAIRKNGGSVFVYSNTPKEVAEILDTIPRDVRDVLVTAAGGEGRQYEISLDQHVRMSTTFQRWNDSAISKTINLPAGAAPGDLREAYVSLWTQGAKGGTVYRDKSREFQILNTVKVEDTEKRGKTKRPLVQRGVVIELPYVSSTAEHTPGRGGDSDFNPDRCFTTVAFNPVNGRVTGVFQNIPEVNPEIVSLITHANIDLSRTLKGGRTIDDVIADLEKIQIRGTSTGIVVDEAIMGDGKDERLRYTVTGSTTREALLNTLYYVRFITDGGRNLDSKFIGEREEMYFAGKVSLRSIISTKGKVTLGEANEGRPSVLGNGKVIKLPEALAGMDCPECR